MKRRINPLYISLFVIIGVVISAYFFIGFGWMGNHREKADVSQGLNLENNDNDESDNSSPGSFSSENISLNYPTSYNKTFDETDSNGNRIIVFEDQNNGGFQVFIMPFDEKGPITPERIKQDVPDVIINNPKHINIENSDVLTFYGHDEAIGDTFEAWFVYGGKLYQFMTYKKYQDSLKQIIEELKLK